MTTGHGVRAAPLNDSIVVAVARLVDDAASPRRPSHSDLDALINGANLSCGDPRPPGGGAMIGKRKRVDKVLRWALAHAPRDGERLVADLVACIRGNGGFNPASENYVGAEAATNASEMCRAAGYVLTTDGDLRPVVLDGLSGKQMTETLRRYVLRAQQGARDAALLTGTSKDLVEATAAHVLVQLRGAYPETASFPALLGMAFTEFGLATKMTATSTPQERVDASLYVLACEVNRLRNKQGTGHGRPFAATVSDREAITAVQAMGVVAGRLLDAYEQSTGALARSA